ncbi:MAG: outer membrane protein assembly factor BamC [Rubrivivax sp.]|nr:outer membrane protein assembly factor BamC [Rubrivivax sp.]MDP3083296.1 outer membrane protein assembly factor BamC [Rubrivivax sp.]
MKRFPAVTPARLTLIALATALAGCSSINEMLAGDKVDYRSASVKSQPLDVPPDLSQLARDSRYPAQGGVVSAAGRPNAPAAPVAATVALQSRGDIRVERHGSQRWLVTSATPEQLWPQLRAFWQERGFALTVDNAQAGVMETDWAENRAKLPHDFIRSAIGRVLDRAYDTGERDRFRTRVERTAAGSEIYITHRGLEEVYTSERKDSTVWRPRATDIQLEAEFLSRLMVRMGTPEEAARTAVASAPDQPVRARTVTGAAGAAMEIDEGFDRAWRRVGLALDRSGFTVEDRDRAGGLYFVRYVDPKSAGLEEPGFFSKLFNRGPSALFSPVRYRVLVKGAGDKSQVTVLTDAGGTETGEAGQRIVTMLVAELK